MTKLVTAWGRHWKALAFLMMTGAVFAADPEYKPDSAMGVDPRVDYPSLLKFGPWDDKNYQLRLEDIAVLPENDVYRPGVPAFFKIMKRREMIAEGFPLGEFYPRELNKEFQMRFGGLTQGGTLFRQGLGKAYHPDPAVARNPTLFATDPLPRAAPVVFEGPFDGTLSDNETTIEFHPTNPNIAIAGSNGSGGQRMSFSSNGGTTWGNSGALPNTCCDPAIEFTPDGAIAFAATLGTGPTCSFSLCTQVYWSFNNGQNWTGPVSVSTASSDKEFIHVDKSPISPFFGRAYLTWHQGNVMQFARSTAMPVNGGAPMAFAATTSFSAEPTGIGSDITTDRQGRVYYVYPTLTGDTALRLLRSDDGGVTFVDLNGAAAGLGGLVYNLHGRFDFAVPAMESRRVFIYAAVAADTSGGPRDGRIYVAFTDENAAAGSPGGGSGSATASHGWIQVVYSDDQGVTWNTAATPHSTADQTTVDRFQPWISVDGLGNVHLGFQDTRNSGAGVRNKADWYYVASGDGGATWIEETRVSSVVSENITDGQEWGDYNGIAVAPGGATVGMTWTDNRIVTPPSTVSQRSFVGLVTNLLNGPSYQMGTTTTNLQICAGTPLPPINVTLNSLAGFSSAVTMSTPGINAAVFPSATFTPNPVTPAPAGTTTVLNVTTAPAAATGSYTINIESTDGGGSPMVRTDSVSVDVSNGTPAAASLTAPANAATGLVYRPTLSWAAVAGATAYTVQVSTTSDFAVLVDSATLTGTSFQTAVTLNPSTNYFWRVRAENPCGQGGFSAVRSFTTGVVTTNTTCYAGADVAIPDNNPAGGTATQAVTATGGVNDLNVSVAITHTWPGDLTLSLIHVATNTTVTLGARLGGTGCSVNDINATFDDEGGAAIACGGSPPAISGLLTPANALSAFDGLALNSDWSLRAVDSAGQDTGSITDFCIISEVVTASGGDPAIFANGFE
jgi:hypothetical protein